MIEVKVSGHQVKIYNSIEDLPIKRFHKYNKCLLVDAGVGSDLTSFDNHIERVVRYIKADNREDAAKEMENMRQNIYLIMQEVSPQHMAFACLVHSIDGKPYEDMSDEGLQKVMEVLGDATAKDIATHIDGAKKKIDYELSLYFPNIFDDSTTKEFYDLLKSRTVATLNCILNGDTESNKTKVEELTDRILTFSRPKKFTGTDSVEIDHDKQFETMCLIISENLHTDAKRMTVMEYYNAYQYINKQAKSQRAQNKARRHRFGSLVDNQ